MASKLTQFSTEIVLETLVYSPINQLTVLLARKRFSERSFPYKPLTDLSL